MKTTWKWVPVARYHISAAEEWLEKMAAKGLFYQRDHSSNILFHAFFLGNFARFEVGQPKPGRRYRLDVNPDFYNGPTGQMRELYQQAGWEYAGFLWDRAFFVYYTDDPLALEPYTDTQSQADSVQPLKRIIHKEIHHSTSWLFVTLLTIFEYAYWGAPHFSIADLCLIALDIALGLLWIFSTVRSLQLAKKMGQHLEAGNRLRTFAPPKGQLVLENVQSVIMVCLLFFVVISILLSPRRTYPDYIQAMMP